MKNNIKSFGIMLAFILLTVSNSIYLININANFYIEYIAFAILLLIEFYCYIKKKKFTRKNILNFLIVLFMFSIGIILQGLNISTKIRLIISMVLMELFLILSNDILDDFKYIRYSSYGLTIGLIITTIIAIITNTTLIDKVYGFSILKIGFNGGIIYKNYFAGILVASFIGWFISLDRNKIKIFDYLYSLLIIGLLIISSSNGAIILFISFIGLEYLLNYNKLVRIFIIKHDKIFKTITLIMTCFVLFALFKFVLPRSDTYAYRIRGVDNYISFYKNDAFHLILGSSEMAFKNDGNSYIQNIKIFLDANGYNGFNGSYEMGFINVLIKNGIIGIFGFLYCYILLVEEAKTIEYRLKNHVYILLIVLLISSLVESYVCNIHAIFGVTIYILVNGIIQIGKNKILRDKK